jgi:hypothetical protein
MHSNIGNSPRTDKTGAIARVAPYMDTIEVSSRRPYPSALLKIVKANSGSMILDDVRDRIDEKVIWHYLLAINQPSRYCIEILQWYHEQLARLSIYRAHPAFDVIDTAPGWTRDDVIMVLGKLAHLRYRRGSDHMHEEDGTLYSILTAGRKSRPYRNTILYTNRVSKITGECDAIHFEPRMERKRSVERVINEPADLLSFDFGQYFAQEIAIKDIRAILETIIKRSIAIEAAKSNPMPNVETRIRAMVRHAGFDYASTFARAFPKQFERVKHWDCIDVENMVNWASADVRCDREVGELHCLLPPRRRLHRERLVVRERL